MGLLKRKLNDKSKSDVIFGKHIFKPKIMILVLIIIGIVAVTISIPFLINNSYQAGKGYQTLWGASEVLAFYGEYLSFIGTIALGIIAVYQSYKAQKVNEQLSRLQAASFFSMVTLNQLIINKNKNSFSSFIDSRIDQSLSRDIVIFNFTNTKFDFHIDGSYFIDAVFQNDSKYPIVQIRAHVGKRNSGNCQLYGMIPTVELALYIPSKGKTASRFQIPFEFLDKRNIYGICFTIDFVNVFNFTTSATIYIDDLRKEQFEYRLNLMKGL